MKNKKAFTLAEVLVTMGIIGVVASMTIPTLIGNAQKRSCVTQLHKVYNVMQQGMLTQMNETNAANVAEAGFYRNGGYNIEREFLSKHFNIIKDCGTSYQKCYANKYKNLNGDEFNISVSGETVVIASGAVISFYIDGLDTGDENTDDYVGTIVVDVNGQKGPNTLGRDLFKMYFFSDGIIDSYRINPACRRNNLNCPSGSNAQESREYRFNSQCKTAKNPDDGCFAKLLNDNWEMKY